MTLKRKHPLVDYLFLTIGAAIMALGIGVFLVDARVVPGGVSGLSMALYYLSNEKLPIGLMIWILNVPLYIWGVKALGKTFGVRTFYAFSLNSFFIDLFRGEIPGLHFIRLHQSPAIVDLYKHDFLFLVIIGAVLLGTGLGIVFKFRGTTGGSDIVAAIMNKRYGIRPGQAIMIIDIFVILLAGFIINLKGLSPDRPALTLTFYAIFLLFISSKLLDVIIEGFDYARAAYIISDKAGEISDFILNEMGRGATSIDATGIYSNNKKNVLITILSIKEISYLVDRVKEIDPSAFIIINNVHEVLGEGFRPRI